MLLGTSKPETKFFFSKVLYRIQGREKQGSRNHVRITFWYVTNPETLQAGRMAI